jgi:hypothetical protein
MFSELPQRETFLGPDYLDPISEDEARALLPAEALSDWRGSIIFKLFSLEIVRVRKLKDFRWGMPSYEAKDPDPEPVHAVRVKNPLRKFSIWESWNREKLKWQVDWQVTTTGLYKGCRVHLISNEVARDFLPYQAFSDLPYWQLRVQYVARATSNKRLIGKWQRKTPPSI